MSIFEALMFALAFTTLALKNLRSTKQKITIY